MLLRGDFARAPQNCVRISLGCEMPKESDTLVSNANLGFAAAR